nr:uncharacterized protein LOC127298635 [Lolium perenne]
MGVQEVVWSYATKTSRSTTGILRSMENTRGRGRPKLTWSEAVKRDLRDWNVPKDLALDDGKTRVIKEGGVHAWSCQCAIQVNYRKQRHCIGVHVLQELKTAIFWLDPTDGIVQCSYKTSP